MAAAEASFMALPTFSVEELSGPKVTLTITLTLPGHGLPHPLHTPSNTGASKASCAVDAQPVCLESKAEAVVETAAKADVEAKAEVAAEIVVEPEAEAEVAVEAAEGVATKEVVAAAADVKAEAEAEAEAEGVTTTEEEEAVGPPGSHTAAEGEAAETFRSRQASL